MYIVIIECDSIFKKYYIIDRRKCENIRRYTIMNSIIDAHELQEENSRGEQGAWKDRALDRSTADPRRYCCAI